MPQDKTQLEPLLHRLRASLDEILSMDAAAWAELEPLVRYETFSKSENVISEGTASTLVSYVVSGSFRFYSITPNGDEAVNGFALDGELVASMNSLVDAEPSYFSIEALERSSVLQFDWVGVRELDYFRQLREIISHDLFRWLERRQQEFITNTPEERYLSFLERSARVNDQVADRHIASYLGITPVHLSRIRKKLKKSGMS